MAENEATPKDTPQVGSNKNPLLTLLIVVNTIAIGAIGYFQFQLHQKQAAAPSLQTLINSERDPEAPDELSSGTAVKEEGILFPLDNFTANLAQGDGPRRYLRLNAVLEFTKESSEDEFKARKPQIRDVVISTINSKRPEDLLKSEGKEFLKEEIKSAINSFLVDGKVLNVYYVGFQIN